MSICTVEGRIATLMEAVSAETAGRDTNVCKRSTGIPTGPDDYFTRIIPGVTVTGADDTAIPTSFEDDNGNTWAVNDHRIFDNAVGTKQGIKPVSALGIASSFTLAELLGSSTNQEFSVGFAFEVFDSSSLGQDWFEISHNILDSQIRTATEIVTGVYFGTGTGTVSATGLATGVHTLIYVGEQSVGGTVYYDGSSIATPSAPTAITGDPHDLDFYTNTHIYGGIAVAWNRTLSGGEVATLHSDLFTYYDV